MTKTIIGIDPGKDGGVAVISEWGVVRARVLPSDIGELRDIISHEAPAPNKIAPPCMVYLESVHAMPKQGVRSVWTFAQGFGEIIGMLIALGIPYQLVTPQRWKKVVLEGLPWKGNKNCSIDYVRAKYPDLDLKRTPRCTKYHDGMADAVCLAEFGLKQGDSQ